MRASECAEGADSLNEGEPTFELVFGISPDHWLLQVRSQSQGGAVSGTYWHHKECDGHGELVARYMSYREFDTDCAKARFNRKKYDPHGRLVIGTEVKH